MMTFPQRWDGASRLTMNVLLIPSADPLEEPLIGADPSVPPFAEGAPAFTVFVNGGTGALPSTANAFTVTPDILSAPPDPLAMFQSMESSATQAGATIGPPAQPPPVTPQIRKALPPSYVKAGGSPPDGKLTTTDLRVALRCDETPVPATNQTTRTISWGELISFVLRQPLLASALGLRYELEVTLDATQAAGVADGGFLFVALDAADPWAVAATAAPAGAIRVHAARLPALQADPRAVFAAVQFLVDSGGGAPLDDAIQAADTYTDGFAKLVHTSQPENAEPTLDDGSLAPATDLGIQIGWDDQQIVEWHNMQLRLLAARRAGTLETAPEAPLGVLGYRVDVADVTPAAPGGQPPLPVWQSLARVRAVLPAPLGTFDDELTVEPVPSRPSGTTAADAWLPRYFATWRGGSLCAPDPTLQTLTSRTAQPVGDRTASGLDTLLSYGNTYAFRVRLADLSGGGAQTDIDAPLDPTPSSSATQQFRRIVAPKSPDILQSAPEPGVEGRPDAIQILRPMIGYPEVLYTHLGDDAADRDAIRAALVDQAVTGVPGTAGLPDPDVDAVEIEVGVRHPLHDVGQTHGPFQTLYTTTRTLAPTTGSGASSVDPGTTIDIDYVEAPDIGAWPAIAPTTGTLQIPRGRDVQITVRSKLREDEPDYFADQAKLGLASTIAVRCDPFSEPTASRRSAASCCAGRRTAPRALSPSSPKSSASPARATA